MNSRSPAIWSCGIGTSDKDHIDQFIQQIQALPAVVVSCMPQVKPNQGDEKVTVQKTDNQQVDVRFSVLPIGPV
ncbi:MAG: hypothetical protein R2825_06820 [Saprospiraceae bacterium]